jgi:hypothetical protein
VKYVRGFLRFWYDFVVGDSVVLAIGGIAVLAIGYGLVEADLSLVAQLVLPLAAAGTLWASLPRRQP